jgi:quercetin dioxygenase-like cupin family protein
MARLLIRILSLAFLISGALASRAPSPRPTGTTRTDLQRHDLSVSGWETLQALVSFAPGASFPRHKHPGEEIIYVTQGTIEYEVAGKPVTVKAGEVLFIPYGVVHAAKNASDGPAAELATYVLEKGKPLTTFVR